MSSAKRLSDKSDHDKRAILGVSCSETSSSTVIEEEVVVKKKKKSDRDTDRSDKKRAKTDNDP